MAAMPTPLLGPPPTNELGAPGIASWAGWLDTWEETAELRFPLAFRVFDKMRTDAQVDAVLRARDLPIRSLDYRLDPAGVDARVMRFVNGELGLDLDPQSAARRRRRRQGVVWADVKRHALLAGPFGVMPLEQVYNVDAPGPGQDDLGLPRMVAHVRKLAPRMPRTLTGIDVAPDGGLESIRQFVPRSPSDTRVAGEVTIPADRLVMFVNDMEGGDWTGRSILRSSYGHWLIKQVLMKLGPMMVERNGMGVPVVTFEDDAQRAEAVRIAKGFRAGEEAGAALPTGMSISLVGVDGTLRDELPLLRYHDESIGRSALAMFLNLGHDNGARSLGDTFVDYFLLSEQATADHIADVVTEYVIRDLVELNYGPDEPYPVLRAGELAADQAPTAEALKSLADSGLLDADEDVKAEVRRRFRLPKVDPDAAPPAPAPAPEAQPAAPADAAPVTALPAGAAVPPGMTPDELLKMVNAAAALIRSGFSPDKSLEAVGLNPIDHLGLLPVTVQKPQQPVAGLSAEAVPTPLDVARAIATATAQLAAPAPSSTHGTSLADVAERAAALAERAANAAQVAAAS